MTTARVILIITALVYGLLGLVFLVAPQVALEWIFIPVPTPEQQAELQTFYGGGEVGLATLLVLAAVGDSRRVADGCLVAVIWGCGLLVGRVVGIISTDPDLDRMIWYAVSELLLALAAGVGWWLAHTHTHTHTHTHRGRATDG